MRLLVIGLASLQAIWGQAAAEANARYKTPEQRAGMAAALGGSHRDTRQKPKELVAALEIRPGMTVVDLGTGVGYMLPHLSEAVGPQGKVIGEDIFPDFVEKARERVASNKVENATFILGTEKDPKIPAGIADLIFVLDAYHHFDYPDAMLAGIKKGLKPGGRLAIVDYYKRMGAMAGSDPKFALTHIRLDQDGVIREIESNGFRLVKKAEFLPNSQYLAVFEKK